MQGFLPDAKFEAVILGGIMTACNHDAAIGLEMKQGEVEDRCRDDPDIDDVQAADCEAVDEPLAQHGGTVPAVTSNGHRCSALRSCNCCEGPADQLGSRSRKLLTDDASNVVF